MRPILMPCGESGTSQANESAVSNPFSRAMSYSFRIRFDLGDGVFISSPDTHVQLTGPGPGEEVELRPTAADTALEDARELVLRGRPYDTDAKATEAARRWRGLIQKAFARVNIGADFGDRAPHSFLTKHGLGLFKSEGRVLNDVHGISVFESDPKPLFARIGAAMVKKGVPVERLLNALAVAVELGAVMAERDQLAYDLYSASFSESSADARLAMLMMALETMIDPQPRTDAVQDHVDQLIADTDASGLPRREIDSILGSLKWLRDESIGQAGRRLVSRVGERRYMDEPPKRFFTNCYTLRSRLIHGHYPRPTRAEVDSRATSLELLVRDLLSVELLDRIPD
jgi:hypothetical protein